jgi:4-diphosphocytidyl-2-C-methyl-D-erythritol kinase
LLTFPPAKLNLGLFITGKRPDGFHALESVFLPIGWTDVLEVVASGEPGEVACEVVGRTVEGPPESNLVVRAYREVVAAADGDVPGVQAHLIKALPSGAGLGGGSSDGTWMLRALRDGFGVGLKEEAGGWGRLAERLGSDCPFFLGDGPARVSGRGEVVEPWGVGALPALAGCHVAVLHPGVHVSTREAFAAVTPRPAPFDVRELPGIALEDWTGRVWNDFEAGVAAAHRPVAEALGMLERAGAAYRSLTGSGSAVYGIFKGRGAEGEAAGAAAAGADRGWAVWCGPLEAGR